jgi:hypothetical protein
VRPGASSCNEPAPAAPTGSASASASACGLSSLELRGGWGCLCGCGISHCHATGCICRQGARTPEPGGAEPRRVCAPSWCPEPGALGVSPPPPPDGGWRTATLVACGFGNEHRIASGGLRVGSGESRWAPPLAHGRVISDSLEIAGANGRVSVPRPWVLAMRPCFCRAACKAGHVLRAFFA